MKPNTQRLFYYAAILVVSITSCDRNDDVSPENKIEPEQPENVITTPCEFDLSDVVENSTISINCVLDLQGQTINLPANVNFEFEGGDIVDGKLVFSGGTIDGRLLSSRLDIEGDVTLKDPTFKFYAVRWGIVEGRTNSDIALENNTKLEELMFYVKELGATTFKINKLDAYFEVTKVTSTTTNANWYPTKEAINIPSDFNLIMTENTHLRIFPGDKHNRKGGAIFSVRDVSNVTVTGGTLHGDRDERVFSPDDNGTEGCHLFYIHSGKNVIVDGVTFENGSSGTFAIFSLGFSFNPDYKPTQNVTIKNCVIKNSRRMAIALVDGRDVLIERNTFINSGQPSDKTDGGEVGYAINIEPDRYRDENGVLMERQKVFNVTIRGNKETGSRGGFVTLTIGQDITVEDNDIETRAVYSLVSGVKIINNRFKATGKATESWAIFAAGTGSTVYNNEVAGNTIEGYSLGIVTGSYDAYIHDNTIRDCGMGIQVSRAFKARIYDNDITASGHGIASTNTYADSIEIKGNKVTTSGNFNLYLANINKKEEHKGYKITVDGNTFMNTRQITLSNSSGIVFKNNNVTGGIEVGNVSNTEVSSNTVRPNESDGIRLFGSHASVSILNNIIYEPTGADRFVCVNNNSDSPGGITLTSNTCN